MSKGELFPKFEDPKLQQLVDILERELSKNPYTKRRITAVSAATYSVSGVDEVIVVDYTTTGAVTINLPSILLFQGRSLVVRDRGNNAGANNITLHPPSGSDIVISTNGECVTVASDGTSFYVEGRS